MRKGLRCRCGLHTTIVRRSSAVMQYHCLTANHCTTHVEMGVYSMTESINIFMSRQRWLGV